MINMTNFENEIIIELKKLAELKDSEIVLEVPKDKSLGDYAFPCFALSKILKKSPNAIAQELAARLKHSLSSKAVSDVKNAGPYINFFVNESVLAQGTISNILAEKEKYGRGQKKKEKVMVEYCQVNTHKAFHVGHLRGTLLGSALINMLRFSGFEVISVNYQGDIGAHVAKSLWYLTKHYRGEYPEHNKGIWLGQIYQKANALLAEDEEKYKPEVSEVLQKLEAGDEQLTELWKKTRQWSLDDYSHIYSRLGVKFQEFFFESQMEKPGKELVKELIDKGIAEESEGAYIINLETYDLGIYLLLKSDGTALYSTKDLALAEKKFENYKIDRSLYVVGAEQKLYFQQLFKTLELMGFEQAKKCFHLPFELVMLEGGKISSREGELLLGLELVDKVTEYAVAEVKKRHDDWTEKEINESANNIALAGIKFAMIAQDNNKTILFNIKKALDFDGETGPYIQYSHARICSILRKNENGLNKNADLSLLNTADEKNIVSMLAQFPSVIKECEEHYRLTTLCRYLTTLAQAFNEYYHKYQILKEKEELRDARLLLIEAIRQVLENGLGILGIKAPERM